MTSLGLQDCNSALVMLQLAVLSELLSPVTELHSAQIRAEEAIDLFSIKGKDLRQATSRERPGDGCFQGIYSVR